MAWLGRWGFACSRQPVMQSVDHPVCGPRALWAMSECGNRGAGGQHSVFVRVSLAMWTWKVVSKSPRPRGRGRRIRNPAMKPRHVQCKPWRHGSGNEPRLVKGKGSRAEANMCVINSRQPSAQQSGAVRCGYPGYAVIAAVGRQCVGWVRWWAWLHRPEQKVACVRGRTGVLSREPWAGEGAGTQ